MDGSILVSVVILTYNHETYIKQALNSVLAQETDFAFEILIGDDCSTDRTQSILKEYAQKYPDKIKLFLRRKNVGASRSVYYLGKHTVGKYLAVLEGDDYWCDAKKLQKQVDFLEHHAKYYACSHWCTVVNEDNLPIPEKNDKKDSYFWHFNRTVYTLKDFEEGRFCGHTSSVLTKNVYADRHLDSRIMYQAHKMIGDRTMQLLMASQGDIYVMPEEMSCYRYIENKKADNWQSVARKQNKRHEEFAYICCLEKYAAVKLKKNLNMMNVKKDKLVCASVVLLNQWNMENFRVVCSMIAVSGHPVRMFLLAARGILQKLYYRKIKGKDLPIKI